MISRQPIIGDVLEHAQLWGEWTPWGTVERVEGNLVYCAGKHFAIQWCFGHNGCFGNNAAFRISGSVPTMEDPAFN